VVRFVVVTVLLTVACLGGLRLAFSTVLRQEFRGSELVYGMRPVFPAGEATILDRPPAEDPASTAGVLEAIRQRGAVRVCVMNDRLPYAFVRPDGDLVGLDVEMAHRLARDLGVRVEFLPTTLDRLQDLLERGVCDIVMSGVSVTPGRAGVARFSQPYLDETLGFVVRDHLRDRFSSWASIRALGPMRVAVPDVAYYIAMLRDRAPSLELDVIDLLDPLKLPEQDALALPAERGSVMTLLYPQFTAVVPEPDPIRVPLAYPLARHDERWAAFINTWIDLKRRDGTLDALYRHWVLGQSATPRTPRWSIIRDVLHWVE
jgi:ABC-type amino acid transport substrate-binding protein